MHASIGRGVVILEWFRPPVAGSTENPDNTIYLGRDGLIASGFGAERDVMEAIREYDPGTQALIICIARWEGRFNFHKLSAVSSDYDLATPGNRTSH